VRLGSGSGALAYSRGISQGISEDARSEGRLALGYSEPGIGLGKTNCRVATALRFLTDPREQLGEANRAPSKFDL
jgi:hypothetical protein